METATGLYSCLSVDMMFKRQVEGETIVHRDQLFILISPFFSLPAQLLRVHHLHPDLHDCLRVLDVLLAGPQVGPGPGGAHHHHTARHVHHHLLHQQLPAPRGLHQGHRRVEQHLRLLRVPRSPGVRSRQLCRQGWCKVSAAEIRMIYFDWNEVLFCHKM